MENYKVIEGIEIGWAVLDETKDTKPEAITEVLIGRLRQKTETDGRKKSVNPLYIFTSPSKNPFLIDWFNLDAKQTEILKVIFDRNKFYAAKTEAGKFVVIASTYHNEKNLPAGHVEKVKRKLPAHLHDMLIYGSPFAKTGGEFYKGFDSARHVSAKIKYNPDLALHISFDFNVRPYMTALVFQIENRTIYQIDEICLKPPRNTTRSVCKEFIRKYKGHASGLFVYGDPSGKKMDTRLERGGNDYTIIMSALHEFRPRNRVQKKAWGVAARAMFINSILEAELYGISVNISEKCGTTITDFKFIKEAADGGKHKEMHKPKGQVPYQKYGHCSDAFDYFITAAFINELLRYNRGGRSRVSRQGNYKRSHNR